MIQLNNIESIIIDIIDLEANTMMICTIIVIINFIFNKMMYNYQFVLF